MNPHAGRRRDVAVNAPPGREQVVRVGRRQIAEVEVVEGDALVTDSIDSAGWFSALAPRAGRPVLAKSSMPPCPFPGAASPPTPA
jgi:hypothetical protein